VVALELEGTWLAFIAIECAAGRSGNSHVFMVDLAIAEEFHFSNSLT
jgi:hypothetical protein